MLNIKHLSFIYKLQLITLSTNAVSCNIHLKNVRYNKPITFYHFISPNAPPEMGRDGKVNIFKYHVPDPRISFLVWKRGLIVEKYEGMES